jgi:hypothetical protein
VHETAGAKKRRNKKKINKQPKGNDLGVGCWDK